MSAARPRKPVRQAAGTATGKRRLNITVSADVIERARAAGLNLSQIAEESLLQKLREEEQRRWREDNRAAIEHFNARVERDGPLNADLLAF